MFRRYRRGPRRNGGATRESFVEHVARAHRRKDIRAAGGTPDYGTSGRNYIIGRPAAGFPPPFSTISWKLSVAGATASTPRPSEPLFLSLFPGGPFSPSRLVALIRFYGLYFIQWIFGCARFLHIDRGRDKGLRGQRAAGEVLPARSRRNRGRSAPIGLVSAINASAAGNRMLTRRDVNALYASRGLVYPRNTFSGFSP